MLQEWERLAVLLERVTYKPGWRIDGEHDLQATRIIISALLEDAAVAGKPAMIARNYILSHAQTSQMKDEDIFRMLMSIVSSMERHEVHEWFKVDGVCLIDPHPEVKK